MGIYIKGVEMPKDCRECPFEMYYFNCGETRCRATLRTLATDFKSIQFDGRADDCQIIEIPPHGRLIDADALLSLLDKCMFPSDMVTTSAVRMATNWIKDAPTIIEAEPTQSNAPNTLDVLTNTCPFCGGTLSEIRTDGKKKWRHCYSCHMEQEVQDSA